MEGPLLPWGVEIPTFLHRNKHEHVNQWGAEMTPRGVACAILLLLFCGFPSHSYAQFPLTIKEAELITEYIRTLYRRVDSTGQGAQTPQNLTPQEMQARDGLLGHAFPSQQSGLIVKTTSLKDDRENLNPSKWKNVQAQKITLDDLRTSIFIALKSNEAIEIREGRVQQGNAKYQAKTLTNVPINPLTNQHLIDINATLTTFRNKWNTISDEGDLKNNRLRSTRSILSDIIKNFNNLTTSGTTTVKITDSSAALHDVNERVDALTLIDGIENAAITYIGNKQSGDPDIQDKQRYAAFVNIVQAAVNYGSANQQSTVDLETFLPQQLQFGANPSRFGLDKLESDRDREGKTNVGH